MTAIPYGMAVFLSLTLLLNQLQLAFFAPDKFLSGLLLLVLISAVIALLFQQVTSLVGYLISKYGLSEKARHKVKAKLPYCYLSFLLSGMYLFGVVPNFITVLVQVVVFVFCVLLLVYTKIEHTNKHDNNYLIPAIFILSGVAALIYQVTWQRYLMTLFGSNIEAATVIVSVFMFGLGLGALFGGFISTKFQKQQIVIFIVLELLIGLYGVASQAVLNAVGRVGGTEDLGMLIMSVYAVLFLPTLLMGASLPILVSVCNQRRMGVNTSVSLLYAANTLGASVAALLTVKLIYVLFGLADSLYIAAGFNFVTAALIMFVAKLSTHEVKEEARTEEVNTLSFSFAFVISLLVGFITLSQEILWLRVMGFKTANHPDMFGLVLFCYLFGIALGALHQRNSNNDSGFYIIKRLLMLAGFMLLTVFLPSLLLNSGKTIELCFYLAIIVTAFLSGGIFPRLCTMSIRRQDGNTGNKVAWLYFANIVGATLGPLLTGFVLLDQFSLVDNVYMNVIFCVVLALVLLLIIKTTHKEIYKSVAFCVTLFVIGLLLRPYSENLFYPLTQYMQVNRLSQVVETKSGIVTVKPDDRGDVVFGGGIYDGRVNIDPVVNSNGIERAYLVSALHRRPEKMLIIGLSSGSWVKVMSQYRLVKKIDVVEINPGYVDIIAEHDQVASILTDPKVSLYFDDGRRWLRAHANKYDFIIMNTSFHWRANSTNLLSKEFLFEVKKHLTKNGVLYYNTTKSYDVFYTAKTVFNHVKVIDNFVAASDTPFALSESIRRTNLNQFVDEAGQRIFRGKNKKLARKLATFTLSEVPSWGEMPDKPLVITDDNMATEFKRQVFYDSSRNVVKKVLQSLQSDV